MGHKAGHFLFLTKKLINSINRKWYVSQRLPYASQGTTYQDAGYAAFRPFKIVDPDARKLY